MTLAEKPGKTAVATITFARTPEEEQAIFNSLKRLRARNYQVTASDGGSRPEFVARLKKLGVHVLNGKGLGVSGGQRQAMQAAYETGKPFIAYFESDKSRVPSELHKLVKPLKSREVDVAVARRPWSVRKHLSGAQVLAEIVENKAIGVAAGKHTDSLYGTLAFKRELAPLFLAYEDNKFKGKSWGRSHYFVVRAGREGHKLKSVEINAPYDKGVMKGEKLKRGAGFAKGTPAGENIKYRWQQFRQVMHGVRQAIQHSKKARKRRN